MTYEVIYISLVIIITIFVLYLYINQEYEHNLEMEKIERLERKYALKKRELDIIRSRTIECPVSDLNTPRDCYFVSKYKCSWNESAVRCDKKRD
jgi:hypothetical protein